MQIVIITYDTKTVNKKQLTKLSNLDILQRLINAAKCGKDAIIFLREPWT